MIWNKKEKKTQISSSKNNSKQTKEIKELSKEKEKNKNIQPPVENNFFASEKEDRGTVVFLYNLANYSILRKLIGLSIFMTFLLVICGGGVYYFQTRDINIEYIPTENDGRLLKEPSLKEPVYDDGYVISKALTVVKKLNTYDYISWKEQLSDAQSYFTEEGWESYLKALLASNQMKAVEINKNIVTVRINGEAKIDGKQVFGDVFVWKVDIPVIISYLAQSGTGKNSGEKTQVGIAEIYFSRVSLHENHWGISAIRYNLNTSKRN